MKVLVADDEIASRISLKANLKKWDYEVTAVEDGDDLPLFLVPVVMRVYHTYCPHLEEGGAKRSLPQGT